MKNRQRLFFDALPSSSLAEWNTVNAAYVSAVNCLNLVSNCLKLSANSTYAAIALSKDPVSLDTVGGHELEFVNTYCFSSSPANSGARWGWYLTRNATLPLTAGYNPRYDSSVALEGEVQDSGAGVINSYLWIQKNPTQTLASGDNTGGVEGSGTNFFAVTSTQATNICSGVAPRETQFEELLNFTGAAGTGTTAASELDLCRIGGSCDSPHTVNYLPWFQFNGVPYYVGYWFSTCSGCSPINWLGSVGSTIETDMSINRDDPGPAVIIQANPTLDTGGFFGPVIKALISIGVYIMAALAQFFGIVFLAFRVALDTIGNFLGIGAIGSQIANAISVFATWVTSIFGTAFSQISNAVTFVVNSLTVVTNVIGTYWAQLTSFLSDLSSFLGGLWTVLSAFLQYSSIALKYGLVLWWVIGLSMAYRDIKLFMFWSRISYMFILYPFKWVDWIYEKALSGVLIRFKDLIFRWI